MTSEHGTGGHVGPSEGTEFLQMSLFGKECNGREGSRLVRPMCPERVRADYDLEMSQTTSVEVETALIERLRQRRPGLTDRELLESVVLSILGRATLRTMQERNALTEDGAIALGVRAVREARQAGVSRLRAP